MDDLLTPPLEDLSRAVGHKNRMAMLAALMGGVALPAGELAYRAGVSFQTASNHLRILEKAGFIRATRCGRHRYYELRNADIADGLEGLAASLPPTRSRVPAHLLNARLCYDHLAGHLGVGITSKLVEEKAISLGDGHFTCHGGSGELWSLLDIDLDSARRSNRQFAPRCVDWSERQPHVAGALGAAIASKLETDGYIQRSRNDRSVAVTDAGEGMFGRMLGADWRKRGRP